MKKYLNWIYYTEYITQKQIKLYLLFTCIILTNQKGIKQIHKNTFRNLPIKFILKFAILIIIIVDEL